MAGFQPGADLDARGTTFDDELLRRVFSATRFGTVRLDDAEFHVRELELTAESVSLARVVFVHRAVVRIDAERLDLAGARFACGVSLRASGQIHLDDVQFGAASSLTGEPMPVLMSLRGTDVSELVLTDIDLTECRFAGAHNLDKLRIEGRCRFGRPPRSWRWADRKVIAEDRPWLPEPVLAPERLAALYRDLRKSLEDNKNAASAGDFYYGEMEARRRSEASSPTERRILTAYWLFSGYGQRASRALAALAVLVVIVTVGLVGWGIPEVSPPAAVVQLVDTPATLPPPNARWTFDRTEKSLRIALGSVIFRDAGQKLTTAGAWTVLAGRIFGPLLLALALLAIRARVKR